MQRHLFNAFAVEYINPTVNILLITVVVGKATPPATKEAPHVIARAVPLSFISITNVSLFAGVPVRFVVIEVIATASAVMSTASQLSVFIVGVPLLEMAVTRFVNLLLVSVSVVANPTNVSVAAGSV